MVARTNSEDVDYDADDGKEWVSGDTAAGVFICALCHVQTSSPTLALPIMTEHFPCIQHIRPSSDPPSHEHEFVLLRNTEFKTEGIRVLLSHCLFDWLAS